MALSSRTKNKVSDYILVDVLYEDGSRTSNRKVPAAELTGSDLDRAAMALIEAQDRKIAEASGMPRGAVKAIIRTGK